MQTFLEIVKAILGSVGIGAVFAATFSLVTFLNEARLKAVAEKRLAESATIENQIKLLKLFTDLMNLANARGGSELSEKAVELLLQRPTEDADVGKVLSTAVVTFPVGEATQDAAIAAIAELGSRYEILRSSAVQALASLSSFKPLAKDYLSKLR